MTIKPPRVFIHDAAFGRLGRLSHASGVQRSFTIDERNAASFEVGYDEPLYRELRPGLGRIVVIESSTYTLPWVGKLVAVVGDRRKRTLKCTAKGYASIFDNRLMGPTFTARGAADVVMHEALREMNQISPTGVRWGGGGGAGSFFQVNAPNQKARVVLDRAAQFGGLEWYVAADPGPKGIALELQTPKWRGLDRYTTTRIQEGVNGQVTTWKEDGEAAAFTMVVVSAFESATQSVNDRPIARLSAEASKIEAPHGYSVDGSEIAANILTRTERRYISEELKAAGSASSAAQALLGKDGGVVRRSLVAEVTDEALWDQCQPGDVIRVSSEQAFIDGYDGPVRVLAVQPDEERGKLKLAFKLLQRRTDT